MRSTVVYGGVDIKQQLPIVRGGIEILVATPGRLLDHIEQKSLNLGQVEIFVLDEADRMLDMGFIPDIKRIMALLPATAKRQNLLFSATFSNEIKKLADQLLNAPQLIEVATRNTTAETVTQSVYKVSADQKRALLAHIVTSRNLWQVLCFVRTKHGASRLARQLEKDGLKTTAIHGDKSQAARLEALDDFKAAKVQVMVATDVAARGLDIDDLPLVVNYELPYVPEDYIHRIGRTGRAGASRRGDFVLLRPTRKSCSTEIERLLKRSIPVAAVDGVRAPIATPAHAERHRRTPASRSARRASTRAVREPRQRPRGAGRVAPAARARRRAPRRGATAPSTTTPQSRPAADRACRSRTDGSGGAGARRAHGRPALRRSHPIPALLMKRSAARAGKGLIGRVFARFQLRRGRRSGPGRTYDRIVAAARRPGSALENTRSAARQTTGVERERDVLAGIARDRAAERGCRTAACPETPSCRGS